MSVCLSTIQRVRPRMSWASTASSKSWRCGNRARFLRSELRHFFMKYQLYSADPDSSVFITADGSTAGHTAAACSSGNPAAGAASARRSAKLPPSE
jgi:hypothetical protein